VIKEDQILEGFQNINWQIPNLLMANAPGFESLATNLMKRTFHNKGVATIEELRESCIELDVRLIDCQMTMGVFGFKREDFISRAGSAMRQLSLNMPPMQIYNYLYNTP
jgi:peroxiredoxin family protein